MQQEEKVIVAVCGLLQSKAQRQIPGGVIPCILMCLIFLWLQVERLYQFIAALVG